MQASIYAYMSYHPKQLINVYFETKNTVLPQQFFFIVIDTSSTGPYSPFKTIYSRNMFVFNITSEAIWPII